MNKFKIGDTIVRRINGRVYQVKLITHYGYILYCKIIGTIEIAKYIVEEDCEINEVYQSPLYRELYES